MPSGDYTKWSIGIISTDHDLHYLRKILYPMLERLGFEALAFEQPGYTVYPGVHSHEACLLALPDNDIVVLLVDKRYGGLYLGQGTESITEKEYFDAYQSGKVIIPCVNKNAEQERFSLFSAVIQLSRTDDISIDEARKKITPRYVEDWKVLDFIEKIRKADRDNFIIYFEDPNELQEMLKGRLQGLTRFVCHKILKSQIDSVKSIKTVFALSLGDVLKKGYYIEPPYKLLSGDASPEETVSNICDLSSKNSRIMIMGRPGIGKSTLLVKSFLKHAETCLEKKDNRISFFLSLRGLGPNYHFDFDQFIKECCQQYLKKEVYPIFDKNHIKPVFYIDGFDELSEQSSDINLEKAVGSIFFSSPFVVSSRTRFAEERLENIKFGDSIQVLIELLRWENDHSWKYIEKFCNLRRKPKLYKEMAQAYQETEKMREIFENPLLLTMFLWIVEESDMKLPLDVNDQVSVYDRFIDLWIKSELVKKGLDITKNCIESIKKAWQLTAWGIYTRRFSGEAINETQLREWLVPFNPHFEEVLGTTAYWDFLSIIPHTDEVRGMFHEQFMEHLLAEEVLSCCIEKRYPFPEFLEYEIRYDINKIIRTLWMHRKKEDIKKILENLWEVYQSYLLNKDAPGIKIRNHVMYYIGRLPTAEAKEKLRLADTMEREIFVKLSIAFGLIKLEEYGTENELYEYLKHNEEWDKTNRGYHLVYYEDWKSRNEEPPYLDDGTKSWGRTLKTLLQHIQSQEGRHIALRRIELFTIRRFIENRECTEPMTKEDLGIIKKSLGYMKDKPQGFLKKVNNEFIELEKIFNKIDRKVT